MSVATALQGAIEERKARISGFVERLRLLPRGEKAALKRNAGNTLAEERNTVGLFFRLLPYGTPEHDEEIYFLIATLIGHNERAFEGDFGRTMRMIKDRTGQESIDRRFAILLDSDFALVDGYKNGGGELAYRMRQCVKLAGSREVGVDWPQLLEDLLLWNRPDRRIRKKWARSYYGAKVEKHETTKENEGGND